MKFLLQVGVRVGQQMWAMRKQEHLRTSCWGDCQDHCDQRVQQGLRDFHVSSSFSFPHSISSSSLPSFLRWRNRVQYSNFKEGPVEQVTSGWLAIFGLDQFPSSKLSSSAFIHAATKGSWCTTCLTQIISCWSTPNIQIEVNLPFPSTTLEPISADPGWVNYNWERSSRLTSRLDTAPGNYLLRRTWGKNHSSWLSLSLSAFGPLTLPL